MMLLQHVKFHGLPEPEREYKFSKTRRWRSDFAWPAFKLLVECEGGIFKGRHTSPAGFSADVIKYDTAALMGWTVLRFTAAQIRSGLAIAVLNGVLTGNNDEAIAALSRKGG